jgi:fumarate reductase (CoM/CoB) subunit B
MADDAAVEQAPKAPPWKASKTVAEWGKFILFEGCIMTRRMVGSRYTAKFILDKYGFDYHTMDNESCCGAPILRAGDEELGHKQQHINLQNAQKLGYHRIVSACAGCGSQLKSDEAEKMGIDVYHLIELVYSLAKNGEIVHPDMVDPLPELTVTAHDPCHLDRGMGVDTNHMHETIVNALPNQTWVECEEHDRCCGAGGGVRASQKDLSYAILQRKVKKLMKTEAEIVLAACPFCELQIDEGLRKTEGCSMRAITPQSYLAMMFKDVYEGVDAL